MPRIDPVQLLKCLGVLLSPNGGIKSKDEVQRLASLMTKFSKKLVSKCIYIQILKQTGMELLGSFMSAGGWTLVHMWLSDAILAKNWPLIKELLELLLLCPVDVERLKTNNSPKLVKELSKETDQPAVQALAIKLVEQWLKLVKGEQAPPLSLDQLSLVIEQNLGSDALILENSDDRSFVCTSESKILAPKETSEKNSDDDDSDSSICRSNIECKDGSDSAENSIPILKISVKDGNVISVSEKSDRKTGDIKKRLKYDKKSSDRNNEKDDEKKKKDLKSSSSSRSSGSVSSSKNKQSSKSSSSDRRHSSSDSQLKNREKHKSSSSSSHKDGDKYRDKDKKNSLDKERKEKRREHEKNRDSDKREQRSRESDKNKESSKTKDSDKNRETDKFKDSDKNKETDKTKDLTGKSKFQSLSLLKLGKIPKKSTSESDIKKEKPSISIEVRNPNDTNRPKTVKMFNSKFRSHGLEEEAKPPPPRGFVKKPSTPPIIPILPTPKRSSPVLSIDVPPEKKPKLNENNVDRPGAIKLIPPKPKPTYLLESGLFMDALTASATNKKEPKKRKRRISGSKENPTPGDVSPPISPNQLVVPSSPVVEESKPTPLRFYQDTLDTEDDDKDKENNRADSSTSDKKEMNNQDTDSPMSPVVKKDDVEIDIAKNSELNPHDLKSILTVHKSKGQKKSVQWRDSNLVDVRYFELDETERVNVNKPFRDMKQMELINEGEAFKKARNLVNEDLMEEQTLWRKLIPIDIDKDVMIDFGKNSNEKIIQMNRQANVLQAMYFNISMIPDSPAEADLESHPIAEPTIIPFEDISGNPDNINDFQNTPWPEPKMTPQMPFTPNQNQQMFSNMPPFNPGFNNNGPYGMGGFPPGPNMMPGMQNDWAPNGPNMMMPDNMNYDMNMGPGPMFNGGPGPMNDFPMMDNMNGPNFPSGFGGPNGMMPNNMNRPMNHGPNRPGPGPGPYGYKNRGVGIRGPPVPRTGGPMGWRSKGPGNWNNGPHRPGGAGGPRSGRICSHFQKKGFCREGDSCPFLHSSGRSHY